MFRLLMLGLVIFLLYRLIGLVRSQWAAFQDQVRETPESKRRRSGRDDFKGQDIEDADYEDIED